jgi:hypothetical protein
MFIEKQSLMLDPIFYLFIQWFVQVLWLLLAPSKTRECVPPIPESAILARARASMLRAPPCVNALPRSSNGAFAAASSAGETSDEVASVADMAEPPAEAEADEDEVEVDACHAGPRCVAAPTSACESRK